MPPIAIAGMTATCVNVGGRLAGPNSDRKTLKQPQDCSALPELG